MPVSENSQQSPRYIWSTDGVMPVRRNLCGRPAPSFLLTNTVAGLSCCNKPWPPNLSSVCSMVAACARSRLSSRARECSDADWARHSSMPCVTIRTPASASAVERQDGLHDSCAPTLLVPASMASYEVRKASILEVVDETLRAVGDPPAPDTRETGFWSPAIQMRRKGQVKSSQVTSQVISIEGRERGL